MLYFMSKSSREILLRETGLEVVCLDGWSSGSSRIVLLLDGFLSNVRCSSSLVRYGDFVNLSRKESSPSVTKSGTPNMSDVIDSVSSGVLNPSEISLTSAECSHPCRRSLLIPANRTSVSGSVCATKFFFLLST